MKRIRGGSGLGDSIYQRPIVDYFVRRGEGVTVCSDYPDVFDGSDARVEPFGKNNINVLAHYVLGKNNSATNQWQDICASARVGDLDLYIDWPTKNFGLVNKLRDMAAGRAIIVVHGGRVPMARTDGFGKELLPEKAAFDATLAALPGCFTVRVGKGADLYPLDVDLDLNGSTSVSDLLDLGGLCDGLIGQCSYVIPLAEAFNKPLLCVWAAAGMHHQRHPYIQQITPQKVLSKASSAFVMDDWPAEKIEEAARSFLCVAGEGLNA